MRRVPTGDTLALCCKVGANSTSQTKKAATQTLSTLGQGARNRSSGSVPAAGPGPGTQRLVLEDDELFAQAIRDVRLDDLAGGDLAEVVVGEVLAQFVGRRRRPLPPVGAAEPGDHPLQVRQRGMPGLGEPGLDELLERGPARLSVLAGDSELGVMQSAELAGRQAAPGLQLQVTQTRLAGKRAWLIRHGSPSSGPGIRGIGRERPRRSVTWVIIVCSR